MVVIAAATPSWYFARGFAAEGKVIGIVIWIAIYASLTASDHFQRNWWRRRSDRLALFLAYGGRMLLSGAGVAAFTRPNMGSLMTPDVVCGMFAVSLVKGRLDASQVGIVQTALITVLQGLFLSILNFIVLIIVRAICRLSMGDDPVPGQRGFEVITTARAVPAEPVEQADRPS
ncbi:MAG: hypothetical protein QM770_05735 [Tepidisphaeraceae bacterium]